MVAVRSWEGCCSLEHSPYLVEAILKAKKTNNEDSPVTWSLHDDSQRPFRRVPFQELETLLG